MAAAQSKLVGKVAGRLGDVHRTVEILGVDGDITLEERCVSDGADQDGIANSSSVKNSEAPERVWVLAVCKYSRLRV